MTMRALVVIVLGLIIAACSVSISDAKRHKKPPVVVQPSGWTFFYGKPNPAMNADGVSSNWTSSPYVEPHYWLKGWTTPFSPAQTLTITYSVEAISGSPVVKSTECETWQDPAASARAAIMIGSGTDSTSYDRAWRTTRGKMTIGTHTIVAPFGDGTGWTFVSVGAKTAPTQWAAILANVKKIGLTFNGCSSMGHGVFVEGGAVKVTIVSVTVS
jgi:hypothetical protein